jgi:hypothetical protein
MQAAKISGQHASVPYQRPKGDVANEPVMSAMLLLDVQRTAVLVSAGHISDFAFLCFNQRPESPVLMGSGYQQAWRFVGPKGIDFSASVERVEIRAERDGLRKQATLCTCTIISG